MQVKLGNKLEDFAFVHIPKATSDQFVEIIKYMSRIYSGGGFLFWKFADTQFNSRFSEFTPRDLEQIDYYHRTRKSQKYFLSEESLKRVQQALIKST